MRPPLRSLLFLFLLSTPKTAKPVEPRLSEKERIGMDLRLGVLSRPNEEIGTGLGYGVHFLFVIPGRFQGELALDFFSSSQEPLAQISVPGWRLREASSKIELIPITLAGTYALTSGHLVPYLGMGIGWLVLNERVEALFVDTGYILTTRRSFAGGGMAGHLSGGVRYLLTPRFALFSEVRYLRARVSYGDERLILGGPALSAGVRF